MLKRPLGKTTPGFVRDQLPLRFTRRVCRLRRMFCLPRLLVAILFRLLCISREPCDMAAVMKYGPDFSTPPIMLGMKPPLVARFAI